MDARRKQLLYRANHRGIKEMDILLGGFANANMESLNEQEFEAFERLASHPDRDLFSWFTGEITPPPEVADAMFERVLARLGFSRPV